MEVPGQGRVDLRVSIKPRIAGNPSNNMKTLSGDRNDRKDSSNLDRLDRSDSAILAIGMQRS